MRNHLTIRAYGATIAGLFVLSVGMPVWPQDQLAPADSRAVDEVEGQPDPSATTALRESAASYADDHGVSVEEATQRLRLQSDLEDALAELEKVLRDRFAGAWIEHEPRFRGVVRLTGQGLDVPDAARSIIEQSTAPIDLVEGGAATVDQLTERLGSALPGLRSRNEALVGAEVDVRTGEIVLFVDQAVREQAIREDAQKMFQLPVRIERVVAPVGDGHTRGGAHISGCTSGFVVRHPSTGTRGYITAGHCPDDQTYYEYGGTSYSTVFIDEIRDADQDVQWHTTSHSELPEFYADGTAAFRPLQEQRNWSNQSVGGYVCHRGKTTGYSCGDIASKTFQPTYPNACPGVTCASVWIRVEGSSLKCYPGDSGGPWFIAYTAYGIYKGQSSSGTSSGDCDWAFYSAPDYFGISLVFDQACGACHH
jgi:streptogrisin C